MVRWIGIGIALIALIIFGFSLADSSGDSVGVASVVMETGAQDTSNFARAIDPYAWDFPADYGAHPGYQTEWWYYTGNLTSSEGERFGYQFTIFRRALTPEEAVSSSEWRTNQVYMVHFTVTDAAREKFYHAQRLSRGGAGLAGAEGTPRYHVWMEDWEILALDDEATETRITADAGDFAVDLMLTQLKPPALQGNNGLSAKSGEAGNASYYYSLSRLLTEGTIRIGDETFTVSGRTWKDHEFGTSALSANAQGWDWFGLIFDNDYELMVGQIRLQDGGKDPAFGGLLIRPDGTTQYLSSSDFTITPIDSWTSPHTGAVYPSGWTITVKTDEVDWTFTATPVLLDQELPEGGIVYWEGAVDITGDVTGAGYAELTGYAGTMQGRF
jgi:predicted secreted hydrolase